MSWVVFAIAFLAWKKVLVAPDGRDELTGLLVAPLAGALGLALPGDCLMRHERGRRLCVWSETGPRMTRRWLERSTPGY